MKTIPPTIKWTQRLLVMGLVLAGLNGLAQTSVNIVGYVNVLIAPGYNFIANPLLALPNNSVSNLIVFAPDGSAVFLWDVHKQAFETPAIYSAEDGAWTRDVDLPPGKGFVLYSPSPSQWVQTFVGEVQLSSTVMVPGGNQLSLLASVIPQAAPLSDLEFPNIDGASACLFDTTSQSYLEASTCFSNYGWLSPGGPAAAPGGPILGIPQSFFVQHPGADAYWTRNFHVGPWVSVQPKQAAAVGVAPAGIRTVAIGAGSVTLSVGNPSGAPYNVQFSTDQRLWKTIATNQTTLVWTGPYRGGPQGYFQLTSP